MLEPYEDVTRLYTDAFSARPPLRVGLLLTNTFRLRRAAVRVICDITGSDFARLELIVCDARHFERSRTHRSRDEYGKPSHHRGCSALLWRLYERFDRLCVPTEIDPLATTDCEPMLSKVKVLKIGPETSENGQSPAEDLAPLYAADLDVLLHFGFLTNYGPLSKAARFGIWSLHYADYDYYSDGPSYFRELYEQNPLSGLTLIFSDEVGAHRVLAKALFRTELGFSVRRNAVRPLSASSRLVMQKLWQLHAYGWDFVRSRIEPSTPCLGKRENYLAPTNAELARWFVPQAMLKLCKGARSRLTNSERALPWQIAIRTGSRFDPRSRWKDRN